MAKFKKRNPAGLHWRSWLEDDVVFSTREQKVTIGKFDDVGDITLVFPLIPEIHKPSPRR